MFLLPAFVFILGLLGDGYGVVLSVFYRYYLVEVEEDLSVVFVGRYLETFHLQAGVEEPHNGGGDLFAEVCGNEEDSLAITDIDVHILQVPVVKEVGQVFCSRLLEALIVQILLINLNDIAFGKAGAIGCILDCLPSDIPAGVIQFVLNDNQVAALVDCKKIQTLFGVCKAIELLLDNKQVFPEGRWLLCNPFLQVMALIQPEGLKGLFSTLMSLLLSLSIMYIICVLLIYYDLPCHY